MMRDRNTQEATDAFGAEDARPRMGELVRSVLHSYSVVFFTQSAWLGALLLASTFLAPQFGLIGLGCVLMALAAAHMLGFDRPSIRDGSYSFNALLVGFALAYLNNYQPLGAGVLILLMVAVSVMALLVTVAMNAIFFRQFGLPAMSLPFVVVATLLFFLFFSLTRTPITSEAPAFLLPEPAGLPELVTCFLQSFGAIFFLPHATVGAVILLGLLLHSRLALVYAIAGFAAGMLALVAFHVDTTPAAVAFVGFNFIFAAIALGGIFFIPSRTSLLLVLLGAFCCAGLAIAVRTFLRTFGIPPLALPFNLIVLLIVYAMRLRVRVTHLFGTPFSPMAPERNFRKFEVERRRFPDLAFPSIVPPFFGERVVTQGFSGSITHRGAWRYALDFEVLDDGQARFTGVGDALEHYHTYNTPVLAPGNGSVVAVVKHVPDNPIGKSNQDANWGNLVVLRLESGLFVKLCHLKPEDVRVKPGDEVTLGALIGTCGNSGRSLVPHLHVQLQSSPLIGAPTLPFRLRHYAESVGGKLRYHTSGVPAEGARIHAVNVDDKVGAHFDSIVEQVARYRIRGPGGEREERIACTINAGGRYVFESRDRRAVLTAAVIDRTFYALDYEGSGESLLLYVWLALARVPFSSDPLYWEDLMDLRPLLHRGAAWLLDFCGPFVRYPLVRTRSTLERVSAADGAPGGGLRVTTEITMPASAWIHPARRVQRIAVTLAPYEGVLSLVVTGADGTTTIDRAPRT